MFILILYFTMYIFKSWVNAGLFVFIFVRFKTPYLVSKVSILTPLFENNVVLGIRTWRQRIVGADGSTTAAYLPQISMTT